MPKMWRVMLLFDTSGAASRSTIRGIARYSSLHGPWIFLREPPFYVAIRGGLRRIIRKLPDPNTWQVDGVIAHIPYTKNGQQLVPEGLPAVVSPYAIEEFPNFCNLVTDNTQIGKMAAEYFLGRRFRFFAYCGFREMSWSRERGQSFANQIVRAGFKVYSYQRNQPSLHRRSSKSNEHAMLADWLKSLPKPLALMACNDDRAQHVTEACKIAGLHVPHDVAVLGVDNDDLVCDLTNPQLSSIAVNNKRAGYEVAELLDKLMTGKKVTKGRIVARPTHVVTRQSTDIFAIEDTEVAKAARFIHEHAKEPIHVDLVVNAVALSRRVLEYRFRKTLGRSVLSEIRRVRVDQVARLLTETNLSVKEITEALHFPGIEHIARYFKQEKGLTLLQYRKLYGQK